MPLLTFYGQSGAQKLLLGSTSMISARYASEGFDIEILTDLKKYRLEGYWDFHLEGGSDWVEKVFKESASRVSVNDFHLILVRKEGFLSHLPFTEYSEAYKTLKKNLWYPRWIFPKLVEEIREYEAVAKMVMLHVAFWYNPKLKEPVPRQPQKNPIYYHLEKPFRKTLPREPHADADGDWEVKAISLQLIVLDFIKTVKGKDLRSSFMVATLRFYQMPTVYCGRFTKGSFWDRLAQEIRHKMPELPFQHTDLLPYNYAGNNIYHSGRHPALGTPSSAHPEEDVLPIEDLAAGEGGLIAPEIVDLIGEEYGSDTSSIQQISDPGRRASNSPENEQTSLASTPTDRLTTRGQGQQHLDEDDEAMDTDTDYYGLSAPSTPPLTSGSLGKRRATNEDQSYKFTPGGHRRVKTIKLEIPKTKAASGIPTRLSASANDAPQTLKNGRRDVDFFREQVWRQSGSPSRGLPERSPSISGASNEPASHPSRKQSPIDPIPPPRRRKMITNLPDDMFGTPPPTIVVDTSNRRESVRSMAQSPELTAPLARMFSEVQETTTITTPARTAEIPIPQAETPLSKVKQAVKIVLAEFVDKLTMKEQVAAINVVRNEDSASIFLMLPAKLRKAWLYNEIGK
ncbi:hypothetical protein VE02_00728 [Pseudogymnoascus sp. 03VT05]|nr:hypothetical protein VE02_00728 [Pseudogymnoascus sp. 03VT05]